LWGTADNASVMFCSHPGDVEINSDQHSFFLGRFIDVANGHGKLLKEIELFMLYEPISFISR
jgi:hypothetical protein